MNRTLLRTLACLIGLVVVVLLIHEFSRPSVTGDGIRHYAPLASLLFDHDLDQSNEFMHADPSIRRRWLTSPEGVLINPYPVGTAVLWAPVIGVAWLLDPKKSTYGEPDRWRFSSPAFGRRYLVALAIGTGLQTLGGMALLVRLLRRSVDVWEAALAVAAVTLGTPLVYYTLAMPSYSHAASFFACAALLTAAFSSRRTRGSFALLGALWGLVALVRYQDAVLGVLAAPRLLREVQEIRRARSKEAGVRIALFVVAALAVFTPQLLFWQRIYGRPLVMPNPGLMHWFAPHVFPFLFSTWYGAFLWSPVLVFGIIGLRRLGDRPLRIAAWAAVALEIYACSAVQDWWGSASCGPRRLVVLAPILGLGIGLGLRSGFLFAPVAGRRWQRPLRVALLALAVAWNFRLTQFYNAQLLPKNPANPVDYVRDYRSGDPHTRPWGWWDYGRFAGEVLDAERRLLP